MVTLFEQVIALALVVGGIVVSALALKNPARRISIGIISVLGLGNLALIVYTYEHTPDVPHFSDLPALFVAVGIKGRDRLAAFAENHLVQLIGVLVIGVILGVIVPREYQKRKRRQWFSSYDIFKLADPALMKNAVLAEDENSASYGENLCTSRGKRKAWFSAIPGAACKQHSNGRVTERH